MKKKFTLLIAALALLTMIVQPGRAWGQTYEKATSISVGDIVVLVTEKTNFARELTGFSSTSTVYGIGGEYTGTPTGAYTFEVVAGNADGSYAFKHDNVYLNWASGNSLNTATSLSNNTSWTVSFSGTDATIKNVNTDARQIWWNVSSPRFACYTGKSDGNQYYITTLYKQADAPTVATPIFTPASGTEFGNEGLEVTIACETTGASIYYTLDGTTPDNTSTPYTAALNLTTTTTVKAIAYDGTNYSNIATATYTYVDPDAPGTANNPYSVAEAITAIDEQGTINEAYVTGIVSQVDSYNSNYNSITYWISDDGTTTDQLEVYSGKGINGADFTSINDIALGAEVVVKGKLKKFGEVYEFDYNNELVSYQAPTVVVAAPTFSPVAGTYATAQNVEINCATANTTIFYTLDGTDPTNASTEYSTAIPVENTTTIKAKAYAGNESSTVATANYYICSQDNPYTVTEALGFEDYQYPANGIYVHGLVSTAPTAAPTSDGQLTYFISVDGEATNQLQVYKGKGLNNVAFTAQDDIQVGDIVTIYGNVKIYNNTKEFDAGNYLVEFERPEVPAISVEPATVNATAAETDGTLQVAYTAIASDRGITWYTDQTAATIADEPDWIIAEINATTLYVDYAIEANGGAARTAYMKVHGKSAANDVIYSNLVTINQSEYIAPTPSIAVDPTLVEAPAAGANGTITVTLTAIYNNEIEVQWFESDGTTTATYDWIEATVDPNNDIAYVIEENTGDARSAYFKVYGLDNDGDDVYSELVTINQAAGSTPPTPGQYNWVATDLADLTANDVFVIVGTETGVEEDAYFALPNNGGTQNAPSAVSVTVSNNTLSGEIATTIQWNISGNSTDGYIFYPNGDTETWLYCNTSANSGSNNNIRVGSGDRKYFVLDDNDYIITNDNSVTRYLSVYNDQDWRGYIDTSHGAVPISFYKRVPASTEPSITLNQYTYNLNADGGQAELQVVYNNMPADPQAVVIFYESDGVTPLTENPTWITATINGNNNVNGNIQANTGEARSAYFKVKGIDADNNDVYSDLVTINQAAYVLSIVFETTVLNIEVGGEQDRIISFEYQGLGENPTFEVRQYDATGETQATYEWLTTTITQEHKVNITVAENTGAARSGYFKVYGSNGTVNTESNLVTINQAEYVAPTYTVIYNANGGTGTMTDPNSPYIENAEVTLLENTFGAPEGKIWDSWLVKDADQNTISVNEGKFNMPASNVTVTAQWVDDPSGPTYEWVLTALEDLTSSDVFVIVGTRTDETYGGTYAMSNNKGTSNPPDAIAVTIVNNKLSGEAPDNTIKWNISGNATDGYTFYPNGSTTTWLYCTADNNGVRVGTNANKTFKVEDGYLKNDATSRFVGVYQNKDWRCYTSHTGSNNNIKDQTFSYFKRQVASTDPQLSANDENIESDATEGEITYTLENEVTGGVLTAAITEGNEGNWLTLGTVGATVPFTCEANTEQTERTATVTLTYTYDAKATITATAVVTQAAFIIDYATLPFAFDGGRNDIENTAGLTQDGLDSDYGSSPKLKFNTAGDWMILKLNKAPVSLSYDIKGNSFSGGSFTVQTSANGTDYYDLATYTELGNVQSITHVDLDASVRYIKWTYTSKSNGNVALGNIHATDHYDTYGDVTLNDLNLTASSESLIVHSGSVVTLTGTVTNDSPDNLIIEDGGQIIHDNAGVKATVKKSITGYGTGTGNYYLLVTPFTENIDPASVTNMIAATPTDYDLYQWNSGEAEEWRNYKQGTFTLNNGIGYLYANKNNVELTFTGTLKQSNEVVTVNPDYITADFGDWTLVGNPFPCDAYIIDANSSMAFYRMKSAGNGFETATGAIKPMEGIFVQTSEESQSFKFTREAPSANAGKGDLNIQVAQVTNTRDAQPATDNAIIRFDGGNTLEKFSFSEDNAKLYIPQNGKDYAVVSADTQGEMPVNFKAAENGTYTIDFSMDDVEFNYLHLIDNKTGMDVDLLQTSSYTFEASKIDYASRFKLVFSTNNNSNSNDDNDFGFFDANGNFLILGIEGTATLQVMDVTGRVISNETFSGDYSKAISAKAGVYMLRLIQGNDVRTQKIVVR